MKFLIWDLFKRYQIAYHVNQPCVSSIIYIWHKAYVHIVKGSLWSTLEDI